MLAGVVVAIIGLAARTAFEASVGDVTIKTTSVGLAILVVGAVFTAYVAANMPSHVRVFGGEAQLTRAERLLPYLRLAVAFILVTGVIALVVSLGPLVVMAPEAEHTALFAERQGLGAFLTLVRDPVAGGYKTPVYVDAPPQPTGVVGATENNLHVVAVLDTGLLYGHPGLEGRVLDEVDFTGEGAEDLNGHGSVVALLFLANPATAVLNVKIVNGEGVGSRAALVDGLDWVREWKRTHPQAVVRANMSLGLFNESRWGFFPCKGNCSVCKAVLKTADAGVLVLTAVGNRAGVTACPAKAARFHPSAGVISFGATVTIPKLVRGRCGSTPGHIRTSSLRGRWARLVEQRTTSHRARVGCGVSPESQPGTWAEPFTSAVTSRAHVPLSNAASHAAIRTPPTAWGCCAIYQVTALAPSQPGVAPMSWDIHRRQRLSGP